VGIEALSRGAAMVYFVESLAAAVEVIHENLQSLGTENSAQVLKRDVLRALRSLKSQGVTPDFIFLDPPYQMQNAYRDTLKLLSESKLIAEQTRVVAEHLRKFNPGNQFGKLKRYRKLEQGDAALSFYALEKNPDSDCATLAE